MSITQLTTAHCPVQFPMTSWCNDLTIPVYCRKRDQRTAHFFGYFLFFFLFCFVLFFFSFLSFFPAESPRVYLQQALKQECFPQILQWMCAGYLEMLSQVRAGERSVLIICSVLAGSPLVTLYWKQSMFSQFQILHVPTSTCAWKHCFLGREAPHKTPWCVVEFHELISLLVFQPYD